jgi:excisionase family DNA binding protein
LLEQFADAIASRVIAQVDQYLQARPSSTTPLDAYRIEQAATALGLSVSEIRRRILAGELATRRVGRAVLIPRSAIDEFLARQDSAGQRSA